MLRLRPLPQPHACSLVDEPVTDLAGQEDVWMEPQSLLVQQVAQGIPSRLRRQKSVQRAIRDSGVSDAMLGADR